MKQLPYLVLVLVILSACNPIKLPAIAPNIIMEFTLNDTDDPAI
ncbi:hypothetical protein [Maribacter antarcticus]|nr:hypothetical protein [Maribacter antarcticus]